MKRKEELHPECRLFVEDMQRLNFGRYENVLVRDGRPCLVPWPRRIRKLKPGKENTVRRESRLGDFVLKEQVADFFRLLGEIRNGTILVLEVQNGLPAHMEIEEDAA